MGADFPRDGAVDGALDGAEDGVSHVGGIPVPAGVPAATIVDDWEDNDLAEWSFSSASGSAQTQSSVAYEGTYALEIVWSSSGTNGSIASYDGDGLEAYPEKGDTFRFYSRTDDAGTFMYHGWAPQGGAHFPDGYYAGYDLRDDTFVLTERGGSGQLGSDSTSETLSTGTWYETKIEWKTNDTIVATLSEPGASAIASVSASSSAYTSKGVWMGASGNTDGGQSVYWDTIEVIA